MSVTKRLELSSGTFAMKGARPTMEDEHISIDNVAEEFPDEIQNCATPTAYYAIYDGHRGSKAAEFAADNLHTTIFRHPNFPADIEEAIRDSFIKTDESFLERAREEQLKDGCTVAVALIIGTNLYTANCGDAEVLLARQKEDGNGLEVIQLTHRHNPSNPDERQRIQREGAIVFHGRVAGLLAVSRAFGDVDFKTPSSEEGVILGKMIIPDPYVRTTELIPDRDKFIIIGCDGVWEKMEHQVSVDFVDGHLATEGPEVTSELLANHAFNQRSQDNISCTIVSLKWVEPSDPQVE